ncbi:DNA-binding LacI/PurR family transcriptional regulator [Diaminobutyricimonas aerilata]|uniref:DNA-binding LacI/PurR family transcriptional regulator n=1 Tax=Diaminobutyricimonas aerilata TaxID=1162967 RepID=A0A2M9CPB1_9MICO|nr:LacI family DNA-binding transcriptional regulator [Diaminobutyricimonas aerilata]PJJ73741.1 DNA-binding LacI/PurR family transcriptional regulator [Diaminobutyricimonas aerilata]
MSRREDAPATILDVAAAAGVSRQTVTRAMNDMPGISAQTRQRVLDAARDLRYRPSRFGRGLVKSDHRMLGLVIDDLTNPYYPELASAVVGNAARHGWNVLLVDTVHATDTSALLVELRGQVDAVLGYLSQVGPDEEQLLDGMPVVEIDPHVVRAGWASVSLDPAPAARELAAHLAAAGVRRAVVVDVADRPEPGRRAGMLLSALAEVGVDAGLVQAPLATAEAGLETVGAVLAAEPTPDAIIAFNDLVALGALMACRRAGVDVPGQVRVVGIDGLSAGNWVAPRLTTLAVDMAEVAAQAVELALGLVGGDPVEHRTVEHRLVLRESA